MSIYKQLDLSKFPDCSALTERGKCTKLRVFSCEGGECPFVKSFEEDFDSIQNVYKRLSNLDSDAQRHIAEKYYGGSMPWK